MRLGCAPRFRRVSKKRLGDAVMRLGLCSALSEGIERAARRRCYAV
ncbi:MAG: hypothetical protein NC401_05365 [Ruminococcus sp.]|nr:hypothetical protein [Ruminococcus sp.]